MGWMDRLNNVIVDYATRQHAHASQRAQGAKGPLQESGHKPDSDVSLGQTPAQEPATPNLPINHYKSSVGQDLNFVKETLRHKIAEYGLSPGTQLQVGKSPLGQVEIAGQMPDQTRQAITRDLNQNQGFVAAMSRLSVGQPTLSYVDNVMKLSEAYGKGNELFQSLVSNDGHANGLGDIARRFNNLRNQPASAASGPGNQAFQLTFNATA